MKILSFSICLVLALALLFCLPHMHQVFAQSNNPNPTSVPDDEGLIGSVIDEVIGFLKRRPEATITPPGGNSGATPAPGGLPLTATPVPGSQAPLPPPSQNCNNRANYPGNVVVASLDGICEYCGGQVTNKNASCIAKLQSANAPLPKISASAAGFLADTSLMYASSGEVKYLQCKVHSQAMTFALFGAIAPSVGGIGANAMKNVNGQGGFRFLPMNANTFGQVNDLLVYDGTRFGHVATIVGVNGRSGYTIVDANFSLKGHVRLTFEPHLTNPDSRQGLRPIGFLRKTN